MHVLARLRAVRSAIIVYRAAAVQVDSRYAAARNATTPTRIPAAPRELPCGYVLSETSAFLAVNAVRLATRFARGSIA